MRSFVRVYQGPQVSLRITDVPEGSSSACSDWKKRWRTLLCSNFKLFVRDVRVTVFYSVVTGRNFGVLQSFLSDCPAFACSVFQVIKTKIKIINHCADICIFSMFSGEGKRMIQNSQQLWAIFFFFIKDSHVGKLNDKGMDYTRFIPGGSISRTKK